MGDNMFAHKWWSKKNHEIVGILQKRKKKKKIRPKNHDAESNNEKQ